MGIPLSEAALRLVDGKNYAVLATVNPDGSPQTSVVWVGRDGDDLVFSTVEGRVKHRNMVRDPRVSVTVIDSADPENYVELRVRRAVEQEHVLHGPFLLWVPNATGLLPNIERAQPRWTPSPER